MHSHCRRHTILIVVVLVLVLLPSLQSLAQTPSTDILDQAQSWVGDLSAARELRQVWDRARQAGSCRLTADVEQTLLPGASSDQIGQAETYVDIRMEGEAHLPDRAVLVVRAEADGTRAQPLTLYRSGDDILLQEGNTLTPIDDPIGLGIADADYMGYLAGAQNVERVEDPDPAISAHYVFEINGARLAQYLIDQYEDQLRESGGLPDGAELQPNGTLSRSTGKGELWVSSRGFPLRQEISLEMPHIDKEHDARLRMTFDFTHYGCEDRLATPVQQPDGSWRLQDLSPDVQAPEDSAADLTPSETNGPVASSVLAKLPLAIKQSLPRVPVEVPTSAATAFLIISCVLLVVRGYNRLPKRIYALFSVLMVAVMVLQPALRAEQWVRFVRHTSSAQAPQDDERLPESAPTRPSDDRAPQGDTTLPDEEPTPLAAPISVAPRRVGGIPRMMSDGEDQDSDGDGLSDDYEVALGTNPLQEDTDTDDLSDGIEVNGITLGGKTWTSNPTYFDSNHDDLPDYDEWADPEGLAPSHDPDGDQVPNIWDEDNDNDGLPDSVDLSPMAVGDYSTEFALSTQAGDSFDGYLYVEFQIQPQNEDHLRYSTTPLDWPHDTEGQMSDLNDSTEDLRLIPYLIIDSNVAQFMARDFKTFIRESGMTHVRTSPYYPQSNGKIER